MTTSDEIDYIRVWPFGMAPQALQDLSTHGGDEDWLAVVPPRLAESWIPWMEEGTSFGCCTVSRQPHPVLPGYVIVIGAHA